MAPPPPRVSISCSREGDGPADGRRLLDSLAAQLGPEQVAEVGNDPARLAQIERTDAFLAVIGPGWVPSDDAFAADVRAALEAHLPVIPVLTHRAQLPGRDELPEGMRPLLARHPRCTIEIPADPVWDVMSSHLAGWLREIARESRKRADVRETATRKRIKLESDLARAEQQLATAKTASQEAEGRRAGAEQELATAREQLAEREQGLEHGRTDPTLRVFISYRGDAGGHALTLQTELQERLGADRVSGTDPVSESAEGSAGIAARVARFDAVVAVVGPDWMGPSGGEVNVPAEDPVKLEIEAALEHGIPVVPVLTPDAELTDRDPLPASLAPIRAARQLPLSVQFWDTAVDGIVTRLKEIESELKTRIDAMTAAAGRVRSCEERASRATRDQDRAAREITKAERQLEELTDKLRRGKDEEARLNDEQPDQNAVYLRGSGSVRTGRDSGTREMPQALGAMTSLPPRVLGGIAAAVVVLVIIIIVAAH